MKKLNKTLCVLALMICVVPTAVFAACENNANNPVGVDSTDGLINQSMTDGSDSGLSGDGQNAQSGTQTEDRFTVTKAEWESAFDKSSFSNCTVTYSATGEGDVMNVTMKADKPNDKIYLSMTDVYNGQTVAYQAIAAKIGETYYGYSKSGENGWQRTEISQADYNGSFDNVFEDYLVIEVFKNKFEDFEYVESERAYKAEDLTIDGADCSVSATMKNGKIAALTVTAVNGEETYEFAVAVTDYGSTAIELPEIADVSGSQSDDPSAVGGGNQEGVEEGK